MRQIDYDGLLMCRIQGRIFEMSLDYLNCSSPIFIKKYMYSDDARSMDLCNFLNKTTSDIQVLSNIKDNGFGKIKYSKEQLYWIGYIYRYFAYTYGLTSKKLFKQLNSSVLCNLYYTYHTYDPSVAIEKIIDNYDIQLDDVDSLLNKSESIINTVVTTQNLSLDN